MAAALAALGPGAPLAVAQNRDASSEARLMAGREAPEARGTVDLRRLSGPVTLDGPSNEAAWAGVPAVPLTMYEPSFRGSSDRRIDVRVAYDDAAIYVAARFFHEDPAEIGAF